jgi:hypothetical protein
MGAGTIAENIKNSNTRKEFMVSKEDDCIGV